MKGVIFILQMNQNDERYCYGGPGLNIDEGLLIPTWRFLCEGKTHSGSMDLAI